MGYETVFKIPVYKPRLDWLKSPKSQELLSLICIGFVSSKQHSTYSASQPIVGDKHIGVFDDARVKFTVTQSIPIVIQ